MCKESFWLLMWFGSFCVVFVGLIEDCFECVGIVECIIEEGELEVFIECIGIVECINVEDLLEKFIFYNIKWFDELNIYNFI